MKHFISGLEFSTSELQSMIDQAISWKQNAPLPDLKGKIINLMFASPSLRTKTSFYSGMEKLGGHSNLIDLSTGWAWEFQDGITMDGLPAEHVKEGAQVLSRYGDLLALRKSDLLTRSAEVTIQPTWEDLKKDEAHQKLTQYASVPVINMESNMHHPCQGLGDMMTMREKIGEVKKKKYVLTWAPHPKPLALATPHSQILFPSFFGMDVTLCHPPGFHLDPEIMATAQKKSEENGGSFQVSHSQEEAFEDAEIITAKSWASLEYFGDWETEKEHRTQFSDWTITPEKMELTNNAHFMHCLPIRRNIVARDEVLDSPQSIVIDQAENRMWAQMALMHHLLKS